MKEINQRGETERNPTKVRRRLKQPRDKKKWFLSVRGEHFFFACDCPWAGLCMVCGQITTGSIDTATSIKEWSHSRQQEPESSESSSFPPDRGFGQISKGCYSEQGTQLHLDYNSWGRNHHHTWAICFRRNSWFLSSSILKELVRASQNLSLSIVKVTEKFHTNVNKALNTQHYTSAERQFRQHALHFCDCTHRNIKQIPVIPSWITTACHHAQRLFRCLCSMNIHNGRNCHYEQRN